MTLPRSGINPEADGSCWCSRVFSSDPDAVVQDCHLGRRHVQEMLLQGGSARGTLNNALSNLNNHNLIERTSK